MSARPRLGRMLRWWVRDYAYAGYWQVRSIFGGRSAARFGTGTGRPVVVLPGIWERWGFLGPLITALHAAGHPVHVIPHMRANGRPVAATAETVAARLADIDLRDVVIVAHSKGGLIGKYLMTDLDPDGRVSAMVAICTPFGGSEYARLMWLPSLRAFSPNDPTTMRLHELVEVNARVTTICGVFDPHIPRLHELPGARNVVLDDGGHFRLIANPDTVRTVLEVAAG